MSDWRNTSAIPVGVCRSVLLGISLLALLPAPGRAGETNGARVELSLRLADEPGASHLEILVQNIGTNPVVLTSEAMVPEWSPWAWFEWRVDGREAEYVENVAMIPGVRQTWSIPPRGIVYWAKIPLREIWTRTEKPNQRAITDNRPHTVVILPSARWEGISVKPGKLTVRQRGAPEGAPQGSQPMGSETNKAPAGSAR